MLFLPNAGLCQCFTQRSQLLWDDPAANGVSGFMSRNVLGFPSGGATRSETPV